MLIFSSTKEVQSIIHIYYVHKNNISKFRLGWFQKFLCSYYFFTITNGMQLELILEAIEHAQTFGLHMIILSSHTSHALQPLDVVCFNPFKITFWKERNVAMASNNYIEPNKITLANTVKKVLNQTLTKKNIFSKFRVIGIWSLNPTTMHEKINLSSLYTSNNTTQTIHKGKMEILHPMK